MLRIIIMAGGKGERLYPLSTEDRPKQLLKLFSKKTLIEETIDRLSHLAPKKQMYVVANLPLVQKIKKMVKGVNYIVEPEPKGTAACIALAASHLHPSDMMIIETADHYYKNVDDYLSILKKSIAVAEKNHIVLLGISPAFPHTGYGYIEMGKKITNNAYHVRSFTEKPNEKTAQQYLQSKKYLWNSGVFIAQAGVMMNAIKKHLPEVFNAVTKNKKLFSQLTTISIDHGVMEKEKDLVVMKAAMHWDDIGDWDALKRNLTRKKFNELKKISRYTPTS